MACRRARRFGGGAFARRRRRRVEIGGASAAARFRLFVVAQSRRVVRVDGGGAGAFALRRRRAGDFSRHRIVVRRAARRAFRKGNRSQPPPARARNQSPRFDRAQYRRRAQQHRFSFLARRFAPRASVGIDRRLRFARHRARRFARRRRRAVFAPAAVGGGGFGARISRRGQGRIGRAPGRRCFAVGARGRRQHRARGIDLAASRRRRAGRAGNGRPRIPQVARFAARA